MVEIFQKLTVAQVNNGFRASQISKFSTKNVEPNLLPREAILGQLNERLEEMQILDVQNTCAKDTGIEIEDVTEKDSSEKEVPKITSFFKKNWIKQSVDNVT